MRTTILAVFLVGSLMLNVATIAVGSVASAVSAVFEAVTGLSSIAGGLDRNLKVERAKVVAKEQQIKVRDQRLAAEIKRVQKLQGNVKAVALDAQLKGKRIKDLEGEVARWKPREVTYRGKKKLLSEAVQDTSGLVAKRTKTGAIRNVAATFGESLPYIGVGVVVTVTAWEIADACNTMKDLHELALALDPEAASVGGVSEVCGLRVPTKDEIWAKIKASPSEAWAMAMATIPDLPEMPNLTLPSLPEIDWEFWD